MSGVTISQLPDVNLPLDGTEYIPLVQAGTTKKIRLRDLLAAGFTGGNLTSTTVPVQVDGQVEFTLPADVAEVENIYINGQSIDKSVFDFTRPILTFIGLAYELETSDTVYVLYSTKPAAL